MPTHVGLPSTPEGKFARDDGTWQTVTGSGTPSDTVAYETSFGVSPNAGAASTYSRGDHTHGTPADPGSGGLSHQQIMSRVSLRM